jgi:hypothetical protein
VFWVTTAVPLAGLCHFFQLSGQTLLHRSFPPFERPIQVHGRCHYLSVPAERTLAEEQKVQHRGGVEVRPGTTGFGSKSS